MSNVYKKYITNLVQSSKSIIDDKKKLNPNFFRNRTDNLFTLATIDTVLFSCLKAIHGLLSNEI